MIGPKALAVEGQGSSGKRHAREIFDDRTFAARIDARNEILVGLLIVGIEDEKAAGYHDQPADAARRRDRAQNLTAIADLQDALVVPLADVQKVAVVAQLRARILRASNDVGFSKAVAGDKASDHAIVRFAYAVDHPQFVADDRRTEWATGHMRFLTHGPMIRVDGIQALGLQRTHPEIVAVER